MISDTRLRRSTIWLRRALCVAGVVARAVTPSVVRAQVVAEVRGRVTDERTAQPIADARVEVVGRTESARSGGDGSFVLRGLEPRPYVIRVRALGYLAQDTDIEVTNARATIVDVALEQAPTALAPVIVSSRRDTLTTSAAVFDRSAIERSGKRDLGELLQTTPGLVVTQAGGAGSASTVSIRGSGANEVLVLVDGAPLNSPISGEADLSRIPLEGVERVVVRTGAQSARYGGRALAGVIEVTTRRPTRDASMLARAGAWGEQEASASLGDTRPSLIAGLRAGASLSADYRTIRGDFPYDVPDVRGGGTALRSNNDVASREVLGTASLDGDDANVVLRGSALTLDRGLAGSIVQPSSTGREGQVRQEGGLDATWRHDVLAWSLGGDLSHERQTYRDPSPPFGTAYDDTVNATTLDATSTLSVGSASASLSAGGELRTIDIASTMLAPNAPRWQSLGGLFAGLRASRRLDSAGTTVSVDAQARRDRSSLLSGTTLSPDVVATLSRGIVTTSLSAGAGFAPPSLADQFFHEGVLVRPNPNLRPERTRDDLEARVAIHDLDVGPLALSANAAAYRADIDDMILWLPDFEFVWSPTNYDVRRSGWEVGGGASLSPIADLHGILNHSDVVYAGPVLTGQVAYRPRTTGSLTFDIGPSMGRLEISNQYIGERRTVPGSPLNALDPYWTTGARVTSARQWRSWRVDAAVGVDNLFNRSAAMLVDYPFPTRGWSTSLRIRRALTIEGFQ